MSWQGAGPVMRMEKERVTAMSSWVCCSVGGWVWRVTLLLGATVRVLVLGSLVLVALRETGVEDFEDVLAVLDTREVLAVSEPPWLWTCLVCADMCQGSS